MAGVLAGKVAVVTGAAQGLGRAYALALAAEGSRVLVNDLRPGGAGSGPADEVAAEIAKAGGVAIAEYGDVGDFEAAGRIIGAAQEAFGRLDILITNAGIEALHYIYELPTEAWRRMMRVHVDGTFNCVRHAAPIFKEQRSGTIITIGSPGAFVPMVRHTPYAAAKAAIFGFTIACATDMKPFNTSVNCLFPGLTRTGLADQFYADVKSAGQMDDAQIKSMLSIAQPVENVAPLAVYLCTDEARGITGQTFDIRGGEIRLVPPPQPSAAITKRGSLWSLEELQKHIPDLLSGS